MGANLRCPQCRSTAVRLVGRRPGWLLWIMVLALWLAMAWVWFYAHIDIPYGQYALVGGLGALSLLLLIAGSDRIYRCQACVGTWNEAERQVYERRRRRG